MIQEIQKDPFLSIQFKEKVVRIWDDITGTDRKTGKEKIKELVAEMSQSTALTPIFTRRLECELNKRLKKENEVL